MIHDESVPILSRACMTKPRECSQGDTSAPAGEGELAWALGCHSRNGYLSSVRAASIQRQETVTNTFSPPGFVKTRNILRGRASARGWIRAVALHLPSPGDAKIPDRQ